MTTQANRAGVAKLWLLNFVANAAALAAWYFWLLIPDAHGWQVALSLVAAVVIVFLVAWLRAGTFAYFRLAEFRHFASIWPAYRRGLRHIPPLVLWFLVGIAVEWYLWRLRSYAPQFGVWLWQKLPGALRLGTPRQMMEWADGVLWLLIGFAVPAIWLPVETTLAVFGLKTRVTGSWRVLKRPLYWLWFAVLMLIAAYVPYKLIWRINYKTDLRAEAWSMGLRFFAAYLIVTTAWIALVGMVGMRTEREDKIVPAGLHG
jgi:hypothetical protein